MTVWRCDIRPGAGLQTGETNENCLCFLGGWHSAKNCFAEAQFICIIYSVAGSINAADNAI